MLHQSKIKRGDIAEYYDKENFFSGIFGLRKAGVRLDYSEEQALEIYKCMNDRYYMATNYMLIKGSETGKMIPFKYREYQKEMSDTIDDNKMTLILSSRQSGKTILLASKAVKYITFNPNSLVMIIAHKEKQARKILNDIKRIYLDLPMFLQVGISQWNQNSIALENGTEVKIEATTEDSARGETVNFLILDEFGIVPKNIAEAFWSAVEPTISSIEDSKVVVTSTPKGMNHLYDMWMGAVNKSNAFIPLKYTWRDIPGRDDAWKEAKLKSANMTPAKFRQEYEVDFVGSTGTLIASDVLANIDYQEPIKETENLWIYEEPKEGETYILTVDTAYGGEGDYSAFQIIKVNRKKFKQVATFKSNQIEPDVFATYIYQIAKQYNMAWVVCESNDIGMITIETLQKDLDYPNVIHVRDRLQRKSGFKKGLRMTPKVKSIGCAIMKDLIENGTLEIVDFNTVMELSVFISKGSSYAADIGSNDDLVMTLVIFSYFSTTNMFEELSSRTKEENLKYKIEKNQKDIQSMLKLFGKINSDASDFFQKLL